MKILISGVVSGAMVAMVLALATSAYAGVDDGQAEVLLKKGGCNVCHSVDKKGMGPSFKDVAAKHKGQGDAVAAMEKTVRSGGKGTYGTMPMPAVAASKISDAELHDLLGWIVTK